MSQRGGVAGNCSKSEKTMVDVPSEVDTVSIVILLVAMLELFKFWTCKTKKLAPQKMRNEYFLIYFPNVF